VIGVVPIFMFWVREYLKSWWSRFETRMRSYDFSVVFFLLGKFCALGSNTLCNLQCFGVSVIFSSPTFSVVSTVILQTLGFLDMCGAVV
jgi:uncharacterized protein YacL